MKHPALYILLSLWLVLPTGFLGAQPVKLAFYNTENLADTIANTPSGDDDFTPTGRFSWNGGRYNTKIANIARVIDDLGADIVGLCEVENEAVLRDLMLAAKSSYNYIHRDTRDSRGMDVALLYRGSVFSPEEVRQEGGYSIPREFLVVKGRLLGESVVIVVCHMPSLGNNGSYRNNAARRLGELIAGLLREEPSSTVILMGDFNTAPDSHMARKLIGIAPVADKKGEARPEPARMVTPFTDLSRRGYGTYVYRDKRFVYDFIAVSSGVLADGAVRFAGDYGIFVREYMMQSSGGRQGYPLRSFESVKYTGGYSDHLPVFMTLTVSP